METCLVQWSHAPAGQTTESVIHPSGVEIVDRRLWWRWMFRFEVDLMIDCSFWRKVPWKFLRKRATKISQEIVHLPVMVTFNLDVQLWPIIVGSLACFRNPSNKSLISTSKGMSGLTTRDEIEFNVRCFVGSRCHGFGRAFLERFIFIKSFLNVVCSKVDQRVVNSQPRFSKNHIVLIQGKHSESLCGLKIVQFQCYRRCYRVRLRT